MKGEHKERRTKHLDSPCTTEVFLVYRRAAANRGITVADLIRELLEPHWPKVLQWASESPQRDD